jgi:aldose 1-epimerase
MKTNQEISGQTREGDAITRFTLSAESGVIVQLISYGATLFSVQAPDHRGKREEITLGFNSLEGYLNPHPYFGSTVGRVANRIAGGRFTLDGKTYELSCNDGRNHLHGGEKGFHRAVWASAPFQRLGVGGVLFTYESPDGEEGYPGTLNARVTYTLHESGILDVRFEARSDKPTIVNLSNHTYWNLKGDGRGDIKEHELTLFAEKYLPVDAELIPTGEQRPVARTPYDFRMAKTIGRDLAAAGSGYDNCYVLDDKVVEGPGDGLRRVARVREPSSGRVMEMWTSQPGVQFYSGNLLGPLVGRGGQYLKYSAFALEPEGFPNAINQTGFPSVVLRPGEHSDERMRIRFSAE